MTMRRIVCVIAVLCSCVLAVPARAQQQRKPEDPEDEKQIGLWLDQGISTGLSANKSLDVEFHERFDEGASNLFEYFVQGGVAFRLRPWFTLIPIYRYQRYVITQQGPHRGLIADSDGQVLMSTRPDIHVDVNGRIIVLDTKWKQLEAKSALGITPADLYQMHAYQHVYGASETVLIFPKARVLGTEGSHVQWTFLESSKSLKVMGIDLENPSNFTEAISALLGTALTRAAGF
jgi:ferredoxin-like protein FixX